jgi:hypothetical protein
MHKAGNVNYRRLNQDKGTKEVSSIRYCTFN